MNILMRRLLAACAVTLCLWLPMPAGAQDGGSPPAIDTAPAPVPDIAEGPGRDRDFDVDREGRRFNRRGDAVVAFGNDAVLPAGDSTDAVVAFLGAALSDGDVRDSVVSFLGRTRVTGRVGESAVAILGDVYVDGRVDDQVVAILGNVELGPRADIGDDVVVIGGTLTRSPSARVGGEVQRIVPAFRPDSFGWLHAWIEHGLLYGRPLALEPGLGWAWTLALGFLGFYVLLALLFGTSIDRCVATLETHPGRSLLASLLAVLLTPVLFLLLLVTVVGIALIPFAGLALFCAGLFGKAVMLAWIGRRGTRLLGDGPWNHAAIAVLAGGVAVLALYLVPVAGFLLYKVLGILGLGVVLYTLLLAWQAAHPAALAPAAAGVGASVAEPSGSDAASPPPGGPQDPAPPAFAPDAGSLPRAGFWIRMGALAIDVLLVGIVLALTDVLDHAGSLQLIALAVYGAVLWKLRGTTVGGTICGLKVVRVDGQPIDWPTAAVRALGCFLSLAVAFLGFLWIAFDRDRQAWHDRIAGTAVVRVPKGMSLV